MVSHRRSPFLDPRTRVGFCPLRSVTGRPSMLVSFSIVEVSVSVSLCTSSFYRANLSLPVFVRFCVKVDGRRLGLRE